MKQPLCHLSYHPLSFTFSYFTFSRSHVPDPWAELMIDPEATIIDFYPEDFKIDLNGKKYAWQGVALLPFVDEVRSVTWHFSLEAQNF